MASSGDSTDFVPVLDYFFNTFIPTYASDHWTIHDYTDDTQNVYCWYEYTVQCMTGETESFKALIRYERSFNDYMARAWNDPAVILGDTSFVNTTSFGEDTTHSRTGYKGQYLFYTGENGAFMVLGPGSAAEGSNDVVVWWPGPAGWIFQNESNPDDRFHICPFGDFYPYGCPQGYAYMYGPIRSVQNSNKVLITDFVGFSVGKGTISTASINEYVPRLMWMAPASENNYKLKWHTPGTLGPGGGTPGHVTLDDGNYWLDFYKGSAYGLLTLVGDTPLTLPYPE